MKKNNVPQVDKDNKIISKNSSTPSPFKKNNTDQTVAIVGLGYVGLPLALLCAKKGYTVIGIDNDSEKIKLLKQRISPFYDQEVTKDLAETTVKFEMNNTAIHKADIVVVCVPTPVYDNHLPNLEPLMDAVRGIKPHMKKDVLIVIESTVNPGVCEDIVLPVLRDGKSLQSQEFYLAHCPERINPGDSIWKLETIPRVVGSLNSEGLSRTVDFYESILNAPVRAMGSIKEAEAVKVVENSFRDVNIAFVNELAMSFHKLGIDVVNVINGASTKPFSFLAHYPGSGVGGHCIPVDPYYLINYGMQNGFHHQFLSMARRINNHMPAFTVHLTEEVLLEQGLKLPGSTIAVLGLSYKPNVDDTRESPSFKIIEILRGKGAIPISYDPHSKVLSEARTLDEACANADAVIIATAHKEFLALSPGYLKEKGVRAIVDGRNCLDHTLFGQSEISYVGIGRRVDTKKSSLLKKAHKKMGKVKTVALP